MVVDIHADDYGYTLNTSKEMLSCIDSLDSISIICNTSYFDESIVLVSEGVPDMKQLRKRPGLWNIIRNPKEPLMPFLREFGLYSTYSLVNFVKNFILNILSFKIDSYAKSHKLDKVYMCGLVMSGHMDYERLNKVYDAFCAKAERDGRYMEFLFHPGKALKSEESP